MAGLGLFPLFGFCFRGCGTGLNGLACLNPYVLYFSQVSYRSQQHCGLRFASAAGGKMIEMTLTSSEKHPQGDPVDISVVQSSIQSYQVKELGQTETVA